MIGLAIRVAIVFGAATAVAAVRGLSFNEFVDSHDPAYNVVRVAGGLWPFAYIGAANKREQAIGRN